MDDLSLDRMVEMFDAALTSNDKRVVDALRSLLMVVILTSNDSDSQRPIGPFRELVNEVDNLHRRLQRAEAEISRIHANLNQTNPWSPDPQRFGYNTWPRMDTDKTYL